MTATMCVNHPDTPAAVVAVHASDQLGARLCPGCATCTDPACGSLGVILDTEHAEPWCHPHKGEAVSGPELVPVDSDRHRALTGQTGRP
ncbi:hypothetical protein [Actinokineospora iranica]|uniref:Uncharacterized protein n=1 Tax=Actinokineospora iranica TaxID=1271860 RepID=A0A1G6K2W5_9PSEU|nr:hypothetical protein [Actinokineospora iranica]SDC25340.1 hypothetical protein SAMN05216174_101688 [Actinokineospora iranica]